MAPPSFFSPSLPRPPPFPAAVSRRRRASSFETLDPRVAEAALELCADEAVFELSPLVTALPSFFPRLLPLLPLLPKTASRCRRASSFETIDPRVVAEAASRFSLPIAAPSFLPSSFPPRRVASFSTLLSRSLTEDSSAAQSGQAFTRTIQPPDGFFLCSRLRGW